MFTGIIQAKGRITHIDRDGDWKITVQTPDSFIVTDLGCSIACSGICLTVIDIAAAAFQVQVSSETLSKTTVSQWTEGVEINLEHALRMGDSLGGHLVTGHVDGLARILDRKAQDDSIRFIFDVPGPLARFMAPKGSVALDGISLTVNEVDRTHFGVNIIPFTQTMTTIGARQVGDVMNCEIDTIARYVARMAQADAQGL